MPLRLSVVTPVLNRAHLLGGCLRSVASQRLPGVEHVVIDGGSSDGTLELLRESGGDRLRWISEPDEGIYSAINKGIDASTGEVVAILGSDDVYADPAVLEDVARQFESTGCDVCYGDLQYVSDAAPERVIRHWRAGEYRPGAFARGWMPPHPTFFVRREVYDRFGYYNASFRIAADYELMLRLLERHRVRASYLPRVLVRMRLGGVSNDLPNLLTKSLEDYRAWKLQGFSGGLGVLVRKNLSKLPQFLRRRPERRGPRSAPARS